MNANLDLPFFLIVQPPLNWNPSSVPEWYKTITNNKHKGCHWGAYFTNILTQSVDKSSKSNPNNI